MSATGTLVGMPAIRPSTPEPGRREPPLPLIPTLRPMPREERRLLALAAVVATAAVCAISLWIAMTGG